MGGAPQITRLLSHPNGAADLLALVYQELHTLAQQRMAGERKDHTLQPTALVNEAYLRLVGDQDIQWANRAHFFHAAAEAMRRILIEHARKRASAKRGGDWARTALSDLNLASDEDCSRIVALEDAILRLEQDDPRAAQVVRLRFYAGLSIDQAAAALDQSRRTVLRDWDYARAWLFADLREQR